MSDTPITDAAEFDFDEDCTPEDNMVVASCDMRKLERELNELKTERLKLHESLVKAQLASVPLCIGRPIIDILAKEGQWISESGQGVVAADDLFRNSPYDALDEANADRLRLQEALESAQQLQYEICGATMAMAHGEPESNVWAAINSMGSTMKVVSTALSAPPPPVVAKADADALAEAVEIMRVGICSAAMPNATEREIASDAVKQASELLKTYRNKYPQ